MVDIQTIKMYIIKEDVERYLKRIQYILITNTNTFETFLYYFLFDFKNISYLIYITTPLLISVILLVSLWDVHFSQKKTLSTP